MASELANRLGLNGLEPGLAPNLRSDLPLPESSGLPSGGAKYGLIDGVSAAKHPRVKAWLDQYGSFYHQGLFPISPARQSTLHYTQSQANSPETISREREYLAMFVGWVNTVLKPAGAEGGLFLSPGCCLQLLWVRRHLLWLVERSISWASIANRLVAIRKVVNWLSSELSALVPRSDSTLGDYQSLGDTYRAWGNKAEHERATTDSAELVAEPEVGPYAYRLAVRNEQPSVGFNAIVAHIVKVAENALRAFVNEDRRLTEKRRARLIQDAALAVLAFGFIPSPRPSELASLCHPSYHGSCTYGGCKAPDRCAGSKPVWLDNPDFQGWVLKLSHYKAQSASRVPLTSRRGALIVPLPKPVALILQIHIRWAWPLLVGKAEKPASLWVDQYQKSCSEESLTHFHFRDGVLRGAEFTPFTLRHCRNELVKAFAHEQATVTEPALRQALAVSMATSQRQLDFHYSKPESPKDYLSDCDTVIRHLATMRQHASLAIDSDLLKAAREALLDRVKPLGSRESDDMFAPDCSEG